MNIIQFKRGTNQPANNSLSDGELYIDKNTNSLWVGDETETSSGRMFQIKAKPVLGIDIINANGTVIPKAIQDFTITNGTGGNSVFNVTYTDGSTSSKPVTLSGSVASATRLTSNAGADGTSGVMNPIYFSGGVPVAMTKTIGTTQKPVYIYKGKVTECEAMFTGMQVLTATNKYYLYGNTTTLSGSEGIKTLMARNDAFIDTQGVLNAKSFTASQLNSSNITITEGGYSTSVFSSNGVYVLRATIDGTLTPHTYVIDIVAGTGMKTSTMIVINNQTFYFDCSGNDYRVRALRKTSGSAAAYVSATIYSVKKIG